MNNWVKKTEIKEKNNEKTHFKFRLCIFLVIVDISISLSYKLRTFSVAAVEIDMTTV